MLEAKRSEIKEEIKLEEIPDLPDKPNSDIPGWIFDDQESADKEPAGEDSAISKAGSEQPAQETSDIPIHTEPIENGMIAPDIPMISEPELEATSKELGGHKDTPSPIQSESRQSSEAPVNIDMNTYPIENGMVDHDVPTISAPESEAISKHWVKIESEQPQEKSRHLEDTQKINLQSTQATILQVAKTALEGEDIHSAIQKFDALIEDKFHLEEIIQIMENSEQFFAHEPEAWFVLGKAYLKNNQKAKALQAFRNAEGNTFI